MLAIGMSDIVGQTSDGCCFWENGCFFSFKEASCIDPSYQTWGSGFNIAFHSSHLTCKEEVWLFFRTVGLLEEIWRVHIRITVHDTISHKLRIFQTWNHLENSFLFAPFKVSLKSYDIVEASRRIVLAKLNDCVRSLKFPITRSFVIIWILESDWLHRAIEHGFDASFGHDFNGHTAFKILFFFKRVEWGFFCIDQGLMEIHKLLFGHWAVEISCFSLVIAWFEINLVHIDSIDIDDRSRCIVEIEAIPTIERVDLFCQGITG